MTYAVYLRDHYTRDLFRVEVTADSSIQALDSIHRDYPTKEISMFWEV